MTAAPWATHHAGGRWLAFRNDSGETIPPFAVLRITGVVTIAGRAVLTVSKPNADGGTFYAVNGAVVTAVARAMRRAWRLATIQ
jgi:hypothetical protein